MLTASSPKEAMRIVKEHQPPIHLLLTDVIMPEMNGWDLARELSLSKPSMKCLFMSGYTANTITHREEPNEGVHFIQKPFTVQALANAVRTALSSLDRVDVASSR